MEICGVKFRNPVIAASGCYGFGYEFNDIYPIDEYVGGISLKGTTLEPRFGNPLPRIAEAPAGMLNSVGLQNPGVEKVISEEIPKLRKVYKGVVLANISGFSVEEYVECCRRISEVDTVDIIELNVSCPNVHGGGMSFGTSPKSVKEVVTAVRKVARKPLFVKLSPNVTDIVKIARAAEKAGADGLVLINTLMGMRFNLKTGKPILANGTGGLSGPAILPVALRMVYQVSNACGIPVIGCGGVSTADDVREMMMAGAVAVEVGSANLRDPYAIPKIVKEL